MKHIFFSPHLDDVVLSCGGMIYQLAQAGQSIEVIAVFAGDPPPGPLTPFAQSLHERWQGDYADRRREDVASLNHVGAEAFHWPYPDAVYRRDGKTGAALYGSEESIFGEVHAVDADLIESVAARLQAIDAPARLIVPLAAGGHVDHQVVRRAAESLGQVLTYYEDYPYVENPDRLDLALRGRAWTPEVILLRDDAIRAKARAIWAHRSQMSTFFSNEEDMERRVRAYAQRIGGAVGPAERLWRTG